MWQEGQQVRITAKHSELRQLSAPRNGLMFTVVVLRLSFSYPPTLLHVEQQSLSEGRLVEVDSSLPPIRAALRGPSKWLVACGELHSKDPAYWPGMRADSGLVLVVDPVTLAEQPDGTIGELWIAGRCVTAGYWNNASATAAAYNNKLSKACTIAGREHLKSSFYRTGDLGCMYQDHLYITGRLKEMIIVNGQPNRCYTHGHASSSRSCSSPRAHSFALFSFVLALQARSTIRWTSRRPFVTRLSQALPFRLATAPREVEDLQALRPRSPRRAKPSD